MVREYTFTLTRDYVSSWTYIEAIRELLQNAYDYREVSSDSDVSVSFSKDCKSLSITNTNDKVDIKTLLLGYGTKRDNSKQVGGFGEGFLLALLVLIRGDYEVFIENSDEVWTCRFEHSEDFDEDLFTVEVEDNVDNMGCNDFTISIHGFDSDKADIVKSKFLGLGSSYKSIPTKYGEILTDPCQKGKMYVEGLPITTDDDFNYGYNFKAQYVKLDRDRKDINHKELKDITSLAVAYMEKYDFSIVDNLIQSGGSDTDRIINRSVEVPDEFVYGYANYLKDKLDIKEKDVIVSDSSSKVIAELEHMGENVVKVKKKIIEDILNKTSDYSYNKLTEAESIVSSRTREEDAWTEYEYSDYKKLRDWMNTYKELLSEQALDDLTYILEGMEPYRFDLIRASIMEGESRNGEE